MKKPTLKVYLLFQAWRKEQGGGLIEYILIGGVVALGVVAGMSAFVSDINAAFTNLGSKLTSYAG
jgi:Flp pilus assembly pilin Flp